jgi:SAM-dependent methyltransferase
MAKHDRSTPVNVMRNAYAVYPSFAMMAAMQLDLFTPLEEGPKSADELAAVLGVRSDKLSPLLYSLVPAGLLEVEGGRFRNTDEASRFLVRGRQDYLGGLAAFYAKLWRAALNTAESIRTGKPQSAHDWRSLPEDELIKYFSGQYPGSLRAGKELARKIDFTRFRHLLDAGGGTGGVSIGLCEACPRLRAAVVDLPAVASISRRFISDAGMATRIEALAGDLVNRPPGGTYDVAVLRALLQVMSPDRARKLLANVSQALEPDGRLVIIGSVLDDSRVSPPAALAFGLVFLNFYEEGRSYTRSEHRSWLIEAGFTDVSIEREAMSDGLEIVTARKVSCSHARTDRS